MIKRLATGRLNRRAFFACLLALLVIDLIWISAGFNPTYDRSRVFPATATTELLRSLEPGRVLVVPSDLETNRRVDEATEKIIAPPNTLLPYRIPTVTGKNQQFPRWYREYASLIEPQPNLSHVVFDKHVSRYFDLLNVRYVLTRQTADPPAGLDLINRAEGVSIYENKNALPRAFVVTSTKVVLSPDEALASLAAPSFDPKTTAIIQKPESKIVILGPREPLSSAPSVKIIEDKRNRVLLETETGGEGYLVLGDNYYPGWRAYIDGVETELYRANHTMRAVKLPGGSHVVSFNFDPLMLRIAMYVSLAAAAIVALSLLIIKKR